jgi:hypothetical protein
MTRQQRMSNGCQRMFPPAGDVVELMLLLPSNQFAALEVVAGRLNLSVGQLLRRTLSDFLLHPIPANTRSASGAGDGT